MSITNYSEGQYLIAAMEYIGKLDENKPYTKENISYINKLVEASGSIEGGMIMQLLDNQIIPE